MSGIPQEGDFWGAGVTAGAETDDGKRAGDTKRSCWLEATGNRCHTGGAEEGLKRRARAGCIGSFAQATNPSSSSSSRRTELLTATRRASVRSISVSIEAKRKRFLGATSTGT